MGEISRSVNRYLSDILPREHLEKYIEHISADPVTYLRVNRLKSTIDSVQNKLLKNYNIQTEPLAGIPYALKVLSGTEAGKTVEHIMGDYYIQGLSSMLPPLVLKPGESDKVLDLAAAPGSKTTGIGEMMNNRGMLVANEIALDRIKMLVYNLERINLLNYGVLHFKGELLSKIYSDYFDKILVDAPCSGLGIIQKKGEVNDWWSKEKAEGLGELQMRLLVAAVKMLKNDGILIYSTCTLTVEENELVIAKLLKHYPVELIEFELPVISHEAFTEYEGEKLPASLKNAKRIYPWEVNSDGFFIAALRKTGDTRSPVKMKIEKSELKLLNFASRYIKNSVTNIIEEFGVPPSVLEQFRYLRKGSDIFFVSGDWEEENLNIFERIGTKFGVIDKNEKITLHTNAAQILQKYITRGIYDVEDSADLRKYLEGGIIKKETSLQGQCVIRYQGSIIGTAVITEAGIKSRFPRSKRTQEIIYPFSAND